MSRALSLSVQLNNDEARASVLQAIGIAYKRMGRSEEALRNYQESFTISQRMGNKNGMAGSLSEIAQIQALLGQAAQAEQSFQTALTLLARLATSPG